MELVHVEINNYRSIEKLDLDFTKETKVFIGVSETGKSNLLRALNVINKNYSFNPKDIRENINYDSKSCIDYTIRLNNEEKKKIISSIRNDYQYINLDKIFSDGKKNIDFSDLVGCSFLYKVDIEHETKNIEYNLCLDKVVINNGIKLLIVPENETKTIIDEKSNTEISFQGTNYIDNNKLNVEETLLSNIIIEEFASELENKISKYILDLFNINVLYWKYEDKNLLPPEINTIEFVNNPDMCLPLKKIFELAGKENIKEEYEKCQSRKRHSAWKNLLEEVSKKVNVYIKGKWSSIPDNTKIQLIQDGEVIAIEIKDSKNGYEMVDRSDGYKRLMTFLIMISIDNKLSKLKDSLILIDSPDSEIDIPSQKYLKNELIEIGKNNYVFYSTHSPYMIDNDNIERHYVVSKKSETTKVEQAEESKAYDNAIILNALGTTLFEDVHNINIAFEGYTDKKLFDCGKTNLSKPNIDKLNQVGRCQFGGLKNLNAFVGIWELICKSKKCIVCIDSDTSGTEKEKSFYNNNIEDVCELINYQKYISERKIETAEDFLTSTHIKNVCENFAKKNNKNVLIELEKLQDDSKTKMSIIDAWLGKFKFEDYKKKRSELKRQLFNDLKPNDIREDYKEFLNGFITDYYNK